MSVTAIRNHVIFQFEKEQTRATSGGTERTQFKEETEWGFDLGESLNRYDEQAKAPQWVILTDVGPEVTEVKVGDRVLIDPLKWTSGIEDGGKKFWRTDETCILLVDES